MEGSPRRSQLLAHRVIPYRSIAVAHSAQPPPTKRKAFCLIVLSPWSFALEVQELWLGWSSYRKDLAHVGSKHGAIIRHEARQRTSLVPRERQRLSQGAASVGETDDSHLVAVTLELRRNDGHAMSRLS